MSVNETIKENILAPLSVSEKYLIFRKYETVLDWFQMRSRRNFEVLEDINRRLRRHKVSLWCGRERVESLAEFRRGETVTFRSEATLFAATGNKNLPPQHAERVKYEHAGTIKVAAAASQINFFRHQQEAIKNLDGILSGKPRESYSGLLVLPTGSGKTLTAAYWTALNFLNRGKKIIWIAHRHELLEQAKQTFHEKLAFQDIFSQKPAFNYRLLSGAHDKPVKIKPTDDLIIASKDSLNAAGFLHLQRNWLSTHNEEILLVVDEAHHATAKTYRNLIKNLRANVRRLFVLGLTATPFRTAQDEQGHLAKVFPDDIVYRVDLRTLINRGILAEPHFEEVKTEIDMTRILSDGDIAKIGFRDLDSLGVAAKNIAENAERNHAIVNRYLVQRKKYGQTIVFALNQDNAIALAKLFNDEGVKADYVLASIRDQATGVSLSNKDNKRKIERFRNGESEVLINVNILTEGTDLPQVQTIFLARPTISSILMTQMIGRGLRGVKAGGTERAYIVSFIDDWKDRVAWVNPAKLHIEENTDFNDDAPEARRQILRLISIGKIEEFAALTNRLLDPTRREQLQNLTFAERFPRGIYHFTLLTQIKQGEDSKNCEILVYDNIKQSFDDFVAILPAYFERRGLTDKDSLDEEELNVLAQEIEDEFFFGCEKYPAYYPQDIKDILQYYAQTGFAPQYVELKEREKLDLKLLAQTILENNFSRTQQKEYLASVWEKAENEWRLFFGYDNKRYFLDEVELAIKQIEEPDLYRRPPVVPEEEKELRSLEQLSMGELREQNPAYWKYLSDKVYARATDEHGFYYSAQSDFQSKNKLDFQIDHIKPHSQGGLSVIENLQLLTRSENAHKGSNF